MSSGYGDTLAQAWAQHLAPREAGALTVASLFAGCGGSTLGYSMAGYRELLAVEWDPHAAHIFRLNFPDVPMHQGDVAALDAGLIAPGTLDVLDGSPPCQGFSTSGQRDMDDPRNGLFREYARLLTAWRPRAFVMENVSGMVKGKMRVTFAEILAALKACGYRVEVRLLDASRLGVPQKRQRLVFIGLREDLGLAPRFPRPTPHPAWTIRQAWADLPDPGEVPQLKPDTRMAKLIPYVLPGQDGKEALFAAGRKKAYFNLRRLRWNRPSDTISKTAMALLHPQDNRFLGTKETVRLQSFPDEFNWGTSTYTEIHARVGNSVPPLMMRAIASTLRDTLAGAA